MIFVTVGTQLPFDRLIETVDTIAPLFPEYQFLAQVCKSGYRPQHFDIVEMVTPGQFDSYMQEAELVISHAGIGTIMTASRLMKPVIFFPRQAGLREHRNNHQVDTINLMKDKYQLNVANNTSELTALLRAFGQKQLPVMQQLPATASPQLIDSLRSFINADILSQPSVESMPELPLPSPLP